MIGHVRGPRGIGTGMALTTPEHASDPDARRQVRDLAWLLDSQFRIPGTSRRFGVDGILGLVPGVGDAAGLALSAGVIMKAIGLGARGATVARMVTNVAIDAVVGTIPVLGVIFDFVFKANNRNVALLERHLSDPAATRAESGAAVRRTVIGAIVGLVAVVVLLAAAVVWALAVIF